MLITQKPRRKRKKKVNLFKSVSSGTVGSCVDSHVYVILAFSFAQKGKKNDVPSGPSELGLL